MKLSAPVLSGWRMRRGTSMFTERGGVPGMQGCDVHFGGHCDPRAGVTSSVARMVALSSHRIQNL